MARKKQAMLEGGRILKAVVGELEKQIVPGIKTLEIDRHARQLIRRMGAETSFDKVPGYRWATCLSVNEVVVHGVPGSYRLKKGDLLKLDIGVYYGGYHVDYGDTYLVAEEPSGEIKKFLDAGRGTLDKLLKLAKPGRHIGVLSQTIEESIEKAGYRVILDLTGHAVGKELHEDPLIPGFLDTDIKKTPKLEVGTAYALEVIYSVSDHRAVYAGSDGWSLRTKNNSLSACFENSVFIDKQEALILVN